MYPGITLYHLTIPSYWVMALIGAILSFLFVHIRKRKFHIPGDDVTHIFLFCVVGGIIGAKLLHLLVALPNVLAHLDVMNTQPDLWTDYFLNGFVFYGGVIGGFLFYRFFISLGVLDVFWQGVVMVFRLHGDLYIPMKRLQDYRCR